jgi:hypothetical protein
MAKLTKQQKMELQSALSSIDRLIRFIEDPRTAVCRIEEVNEATANTAYRPAKSHRSQHYVGRDNHEWDINWIYELTPINKEIGSDLIAIYSAKKSIERLMID